MADPSDRFVYGVSTYKGVATVAGFGRNSNGALQALPGPSGCIRRQTDSRRYQALCGVARGLREPVDVWMAPDGKHLYVLTHGSELLDDGGVVTLAIGANGQLRQLKKKAGCITQLGKAGCAKGRSMDEGSRLTMSLDGQSMYVTSQTGGVATLKVNPDRGTLYQPKGEFGCVLSSYNPVRSSCRRAPIPDVIPVDIVVAPDGNYVYVLMSLEGVGAVVAYHRNPDNGVLRFANCIAENTDEGVCAPVIGLAGARGIAISPDGRTMYVVAHYFADGGTVTSFARDANTGMLAQLSPGGCFAAMPYPDCGGQGPNFLDPSSIAASHDGAMVYVAYTHPASGSGGVLTSWSRDSSAGALSYAGCVALNAKGCSKVRGVKYFNQVTISVDGRTLYLGGSKDVGVFDLGG